MEEKGFQSILHSVVLEDRNHLTVSGVKDVESFDEQNIVAQTVKGEMTVSGSGLKINRFSTELGELLIDGEISSIAYSDDLPHEGGFFSRIFR